MHNKLCYSLFLRFLILKDNCQDTLFFFLLNYSTERVPQYRISYSCTQHPYIANKETNCQEFFQCFMNSNSLFYFNLPKHIITTLVTYTVVNLFFGVKSNKKQLQGTTRSTLYKINQ